MSGKWPQARSFNVAQQLAALQALYPAGAGWLSRGTLVWECPLRPSPFSRKYVVRIGYRQGHFPRTRVIHPTVRSLAGDRKIPHVYAEPDDPLCLFYAPAREWNSSLSLARTIIPWACEWLFHFEAWLFTGEWDGGGVHCQSGEPRPQHDRSIVGG